MQHRQPLRKAQAPAPASAASMPRAVSKIGMRRRQARSLAGVARRGDVARMGAGGSRAHRRRWQRPSRRFRRFQNRRLPMGAHDRNRADFAD